MRNRRALSLFACASRCCDCARITLRVRSLLFSPHFHAPASCHSSASKHGEEVLLCLCATRASLWMGNHGDELWPAWVPNRSGCVQQFVCHSLVPPFRVYEEKLCVLDRKHVHLFARCVAFSCNAVFPYCITAFWDCRRTTAYLFRPERCFSWLVQLCGSGLHKRPWEELVYGYQSQHVTLRLTPCDVPFYGNTDTPPPLFFFFFPPAVAAPANCSVA